MGSRARQVRFPALPALARRAAAGQRSQLLFFSQKMTIWGYKVNFGGPVGEEGVCAKKFAGMALVRLTSRAGAAAPAG